VLIETQFTLKATFLWNNAMHKLGRQVQIFGRI